MTEISENIDAIIIGGGFAGMNAARLLSKKQINCEIFTSGFGASNLWVGTIDFLKSQTNNLEKRLKEHRNKSSKSAKYIRYFSGFKLVYFEKRQTRKEAMQRENQLKKWSRAKKEALIRGDLKLLKTI